MPSSSPAPTRYLITGLPRAGTNLLLHALSAHPQVLAYNELFNVHKVLWGSSDMDEEADPTYLEFRDQHPLAFIEHVMTPNLPEIRAVGFKLFYMQAGLEESEKFQLVWPYMQRMKGLKVVDIVRRNRLEQAFSWIKARRTQVWIETGDAPHDSQKSLFIPYDELLGYFRWFNSMQHLRLKLLDGMDVLEVKYEQLVEDYPSHILRVQQHLGVIPLRLPPSTRKQRTRPIHRSIANYEDLRRQFAQTPFGIYFDMSEAKRGKPSAVAA